MPPRTARDFLHTYPSRDVVTATLSRLVPNFAQGRWVGAGNRYAGRLRERVEFEHDQRRRFSDNQLADVIAASAPLHVVDAWSYLGQALHAHFTGNPDVARHLAYYAELRAAMAILNAHGTCVLNFRHLVVENRAGAASCVLFKGENTHRFAWAALSDLADSPIPADSIYQFVRPFGKPLAEWLRRFGVEPAAKARVAAWLAAWGIDIRRFENDRDVRNFSSYEATRILGVDTRSSLGAAKTLLDFWGHFEPAPGAPFEFLDKFLLRAILHWAYHEILGKQKTKPPPLEELIANVLSKSGFGQEAQTEITRFLAIPQSEPDPLLLQLAVRTDRPSSRDQDLQVISRAALLARLATGMVGHSLSLAGIAREDLSFWWGPMGLALGFWAPGDEPSEFGRLWADLEPQIEDLDRWHAASQPPAAEPAIKSFLTAMAIPTQVLCGCERIALWGFDL